ncbi:MAG: hypothetical protein F4X40_06555 [Chloroflexi bacterium]|nr:hypothetical protein [Chloroflexota bacterium]
MRPISGRRLAVTGMAALLAACAPIQSEPHLSPTAAAAPSAVSSMPTTAASHDPPAAPLAPKLAHTPTLSSSPSSADRQRGDPSPSEDRRSVASGDTARPTLRLPIAADLGPNYFELLAVARNAGHSLSQAGQVGVAVVGFGFSERAKLRDERIERGGPLAAIGRLTRHHSVESAARFAAAPDAAAGQALPASAGAASQLGLTATLTESPSSSQELAQGFTATRTLQAGWFAALDGSRIHSVVETWTARRDRTVLTVVLVWRSRINDGWGRALVRRLAQPRPEQAAPRAP